MHTLLPSTDIACHSERLKHCHRWPSANWLRPPLSLSLSLSLPTWKPSGTHKMTDAQPDARKTCRVLASAAARCAQPVCVVTMHLQTRTSNSSINRGRSPICLRLWNTPPVNQRGHLSRSAWPHPIPSHPMPVTAGNRPPLGRGQAKRPETKGATLGSANETLATDCASWVRLCRRVSGARQAVSPTRPPHLQLS
ncbi:hypothetical protein LX36DRAFT_108892 [Colletotrichum falcatum]|nr:hypothetical protein LX36DRAFT_108892 [Colletotrichum falcatum]